ncbi:MAG: hypothetical protein J2P22_13050 [Nocardioides sp.]|nr:hypothetical protein [Nocardioides sp.]
MTVDVALRDAVRAACEPVFMATDVGFVWNRHVSFDEEHPSLLWEADPVLFAARYPESRIEEGYGDQWPPPCIDYWIHINPADMTARLSMEGGRDETVTLTGDASEDGRLLAEEFARSLRVAPPQE